MFKKPNFFILGAPKCGTTSIADWLSGHPNIFMSPNKEPNYFNTDSRFTGRLSSSAYQRLFARAGKQHKVIGEATTGYLRSEVAVENILRECGAPKFVVCIRNPIEMAISMHGQRLVEGLETELDFERAWRLQTERRFGRNKAISCSDPENLLYGPICLLGAQLKRLFSLVPKEDVLVVVLDDLRSDPRREYLRLLEFLQLPDDGLLEFPVRNERRDVSNVVLRRTIQLVAFAKRIFPLRFGLGLLDSLSRRQSASLSKPTLSPTFLAELRDYFREDVSLLSELLGRDFSSWLIDVRSSAGKSGGMNTHGILAAAGQRVAGQ